MPLPIKLGPILVEIPTKIRHSLRGLGDERDVLGHQILFYLLRNVARVREDQAPQAFEQSSFDWIQIVAVGLGQVERHDLAFSIGDDVQFEADIAAFVRVTETRLSPQAYERLRRAVKAPLIVDGFDFNLWGSIFVESIK